MKKYNLYPVKKKFQWGEMEVIELGERGRGRRYALIPYHAGNSEYVEIGTTRSGKPKIVPSENPKNWLAHISSEGTYTRGTYGSVYCLPKDRDKIKIVEWGMGAYGDAGRLGEWYDFLLIIPENTFLKVRPSGGSHKRPRYWLYFGENEVYRVEKEEMDLFCEQMELERPPEKFNELVDLASLIKEV